MLLRHANSTALDGLRVIHGASRTLSGGQHCGSAAVLAFLTGVLVPDLAVLLLTQLPAHVPGKEAEDGASTWAPAPHLGDQEGVPSSWLQPGTKPAVVSIWGTNQQVEAHSLSLSLSLLLSKK